MLITPAACLYRYAVDAIYRLASVGSGDALATVRYIITHLDGKKGYSLGSSSDSLEVHKNDPLKGLKEALTMLKEDKSKSRNLTDRLFKLFHFGIEIRHLQNTHKKELANLLKKESSNQDIRAATRIVAIAYAISPRNPFGVFVIPLLGLDYTTLSDSLMSGKIIALIGLLTMTQWTNDEHGVTADLTDEQTEIEISNILHSSEPSNEDFLRPFCHWATVHHVVNGLLPAMEIIMVGNTRILPQVDKRLRSYLIARDPHKDKGWRFRVQVSSESYRVEVSMPGPHLIDSAYKKNVPEDFRPRGKTIVSLLNDKIHIDHFLHEEFLDRIFYETPELAIFGLYVFAYQWGVQSPSIKEKGGLDDEFTWLTKEGEISIGADALDLYNRLPYSLAYWNSLTLYHDSVFKSEDDRLDHKLAVEKYGAALTEDSIKLAKDSDLKLKKNYHISYM